MGSTCHPGRRAGAAAAAMLVAIVAVAACSRPWPPPSTTTTTGSTLPPPVSCGTIYYASGWPTTTVGNLDAGPGRCLLDAWADGRPATLVTREQTDGQGGHIVIRTYEVIGPDRLVVTVDRRGALTPGGVTVEHCTGLTHTTTHLRPEGCIPA